MLHLKRFTAGELLFNEEETKDILAFFFPNYSNQIAAIEVTDKTREFAQGLLVEAIDASFALGFVEAFFSSIANPSASVTAIIRKFSFKAGKHWFKHATTSDLRKVKIYYMVRQRLQINFKVVIGLVINGMDFAKLVHSLPAPELHQYA